MASDERTVIRLNEYQTAEPECCGSCDYFTGRGDGHGICHFRFPPWVRRKGDQPDDLNEVDPRTVRDLDGCSLYKPRSDGGELVLFSQGREWTAGSPSK